MCGPKSIRYRAMGDEHRYQIVLTTCPDEDCAGRLATALVEEGLAACVNVIPGVRSVYRWQGRTETAEEKLLLIKGTALHYKSIEQRILALHPYELPEIVAVPVATGLEAYLSWLAKPE